jgi:hypothetical protein
VANDAAVPSTPPRTGSALLRVVWMASIPFILLCILLVADQATWTLGRYDLVLAALLLAAVVSRAVDALWLGGTTAENEPADRSHVIRYAARLILATGAAWFLAQSVEL